MKYQEVGVRELDDWDSNGAEVQMGLSRVPEGLIPTKNSETVNCLPWVSICITEEPNHLSTAQFMFCEDFLFLTFLEMSHAYTFFGQGAVLVTAKLSKAQLPLLSLQRFLYKMEDFIQQNAAAIFKRIIVFMGGKCSYQGPGWDEGSGHIRKLREDEKKESNRTHHAGKSNVQRHEGCKGWG